MSCDNRFNCQITIVNSSLFKTDCSFDQIGFDFKSIIKKWKQSVFKKQSTKLVSNLNLISNESFISHILYKVFSQAIKYLFKLKYFICKYS